MTHITRPKNAATLILVRPDGKRGFEVLLTRRPLEMDFLGGYYVFPGGTVRKEDYTEGMIQRCVGRSLADAQRALGADLSPALSFGHWVASVRELFEEVGVLFCVSESAQRMETSKADLQMQLTVKRRALLDGALTFLTILESECLLCDLAPISYFSHWQTPEEFPVRFDTRFYVALLPERQRILGDSKEVTETLWTAPEEAIVLYQKKKLPLIFPTYASLRMLADFDSLESLCLAYRLRQRDMDE